MMFVCLLIDRRDTHIILLHVLTDVICEWGVYWHMGSVLTYGSILTCGLYWHGVYIDIWVYTDIWGLYWHTGSILTYGVCIDIWGLYWHGFYIDMGSILTWGLYRHGICTDMGSILTYGIYTDIGPILTWGLYWHMGSILTYGVCIDIQGLDWDMGSILTWGVYWHMKAFIIWLINSFVGQILCDLPKLEKYRVTCLYLYTVKRTALLCIIMQRVVVISYRRFGTTYRSHLQMGPVGCPKTSVRNYHHLPRNNSVERSSHLLRGGSLKSRNCPVRLYSDGFSVIYLCKPIWTVLNLVVLRTALKDPGVFRLCRSAPKHTSVCKPSLKDIGQNSVPLTLNGFIWLRKQEFEQAAVSRKHTHVHVTDEELRSLSCLVIAVSCQIGVDEIRRNV